jgi:hypothetical protein
VCVINCCWIRCLWVKSPLDACGWDLICQGESRKFESVTQFLRISSCHRVFHREVIWDHFASSGLSTEYRRFPITYVYSSTLLTRSSFFLSVDSRTVWKFSRIWANCRSDATWLINVGKCRTIKFSRSWHPVEFSYMLGGTVLDQMSSINGRENDFFGTCGRLDCNGFCNADLSGDFRWNLEIHILWSFSTRLWFFQNWNTQVACGSRSMTFVLTRCWQGVDKVLTRCWQGLCGLG